MLVITFQAHQQVAFAFNLKANLLKAVIACRNIYDGPGYRSRFTDNSQNQLIIQIDIRGGSTLTVNIILSTANKWPTCSAL
jgi:hypothetical protein